MNLRISGPIKSPRTDMGMAHIYRNETDVATVLFNLSASLLPKYWETSIDTPVPMPKNMHRSISTG